MKKNCALKAVLCVVCIGAAGFFAYRYVKSGKLKELLFGKYEDLTLKLIDIARLGLDLLSWPINYVKALLP